MLKYPKMFYYKVFESIIKYREEINIVTSMLKVTIEMVCINCALLNAISIIWNFMF